MLQSHHQKFYKKGAKQMFTKNLEGGGLLNRTLKILLIPILALSLVSCGSSSDDKSPKTPPTVNPTPTPN